MLNLIKAEQKKSAIFLRRAEGGLMMASFVIFDEIEGAQLIGEKLLNQRALEQLLSQRESLEARNIFIFEDRETETVVLIGAIIPPVFKSAPRRLIHSPYFEELFREAEFFSTQKTRGPNAE